MMMRISRARRALLSLALAVTWSAGFSPASWAQDASPPKKGAATTQVAVDVNAATEQELTAVPGIGKSIARRIVEFREKNGPYQRVDDLLKVQGIGEKSLQKLRPYVTAGKTR